MIGGKILNAENIYILYLQHGIGNLAKKIEVVGYDWLKKSN